MLTQASWKLDPRVGGWVGSQIISRQGSKVLARPARALLVAHEGTVEGPNTWTWHPACSSPKISQLESPWPSCCNPKLFLARAFGQQFWDLCTPPTSKHHPRSTGVVRGDDSGQPARSWVSPNLRPLPSQLGLCLDT